jgi:hypothetical protein
MARAVEKVQLLQLDEKNSARALHLHLDLIQTKLIKTLYLSRAARWRVTKVLKTLGSVNELRLGAELHTG